MAYALQCVLFGRSLLYAVLAVLQSRLVAVAEAAVRLLLSRLLRVWWLLLIRCWNRCRMWQPGVRQQQPALAGEASEVCLRLFKSAWFIIN